MICSLDHIPETPKDLWKCPRCSTPYPDFYVNEVYDQAPDNCERVHPQDELICLGCDAIMSGQEFIQELSEQKKVEVCPKCGGKGIL